MGRREQLQAELAALELEGRLVELKGDEPEPCSKCGRPQDSAPSEELQQAKRDLRAARRVFRTLRADTPAEESAGDAAVRPEPVKATAKALRPGGKG